MTIPSPALLLPEVAGTLTGISADHCRTPPIHFAVLLVDSEDPVPAGKTVIAHLRDRDHWTNLPNGQVHLMVQCMETWFLADKAALVQYYGDGFKQSALPPNPMIETISKKDVFEGLERATAATKKNYYHKTRHGFDILARLDPGLVQQQSPFAAALFTALLGM